MRKPTKEELDELAEFVCNRNYLECTKEDYAEERNGLEHQAICVFENYITDCPGYAGRVLVIVWGGAPEYTETFIWSRDQDDPTIKLRQVEIEV